MARHGTPTNKAPARAPPRPAHRSLVPAEPSQAHTPGPIAYHAWRREPSPLASCASQAQPACARTHFATPSHVHSAHTLDHDERIRRARRCRQSLCGPRVRPNATPRPSGKRGCCDYVHSMRGIRASRAPLGVGGIFSASCSLAKNASRLGESPVGAAANAPRDSVV